MPNIIVDHDKCTACGACYAMYPEFFKEGKEGKSEVLSHDYKQYNYNKDEIIKACPAQAISII
ncbi:MAG: ferredoxin [Candidatus Kuenenbacteria bacterium]